MASEHAGHRQRMRERFLAQGLEGFAAHEVLELILMYAIPQKNVNPLAHRLMNHFGTLHAVLEADVGELMKVDGVGEYAAALLSLFAHVDRKLELSRSTQKKQFTNRESCKAHCLGLLAGRRQEHLYLVCLNPQMEVIQDALIARGTLDEVPAYPRLVAEAALRHNAHAAVLCHNHPGGSSRPSQADLDMTAALGRMLTSLDVTLLDHIIVAGEEAVSLVECRLMRHEPLGGTLLTNVADPGGDVRIRRKVEAAAAGKGSK